MGDYFTELKQVEEYLNRPVDSFLWAFAGDSSMEITVVATVKEENDPRELINQYGLPNLYLACDEAINLRRRPIEQRPMAFESWLVMTPREKIEASLPIKPLEQLAATDSKSE